ncbi:MAG: CHASE2 domain-containing protein [Gammaproteobacteria bacterium]|nr:MAG: CHASE2 domain-containing protein [Gammaproteobacteria bacterium]
MVASLLACMTVLVIVPHLRGALTLVDDAANSSRQWLTDLVVKLSKDKSFGGSGDTEISILAVDNPTYKSWREPYITPRDKLEAMIDFASAHKASVVVVDFDLSRSEAWEGLTRGDRKLLQYLIKLDSAPAGRVPVVILLRDVGRDGNKKKVYDSFLRRNAPDLDDERGNVFWAASTVPLDNDGLIRRFNWFENINQTERIVSAPLLASYLIRKMHELHNPDKAIRATHQWQRSISSVLDGYPDVSLLARLAHKKSEHYRKSFDYSPSIIMWHENRAADIRVNGFLEISGKRIKPDVYRDNIVFIGAMNNRTMDRYETPIGSRFGVEVLAQSTATILNHGGLQPLHGAGLYLYNFLLLVAMTLILLLPGIVPILVVTALAGTLIYLPVAFFLYQHGISLDGAPPILLIELAEPMLPYVLGLVLNARYLLENRKKIATRIVEVAKYEWNKFLY